MPTYGQFQKKPASQSAPTSFFTPQLFQSRPFRDPTIAPAPEASIQTRSNEERDSNGNPTWWSRLQFSSTPAVQPKLTVGAPNDQYEQEADRVADQVMSMPDQATQPIQREAAPEEDELQTKLLAASITPLVQREAMPEEEEIQTKSLGHSALQREEMPEEEEPLQAKLTTGSLQREEMAAEEEDLQMKAIDSIQREDMPEEEEIQTKPSLQRASDGSLQAGSSIESRLNSSKGGGSPLSDEVRSFMEPRFGADFSEVKVHTDAQADQLNRSVQARAFTTGQDVFFRQGEYNPGSRGGQELIAHELTHVVQQNGDVQQKANANHQIQRTSDSNNEARWAKGANWRSENSRYASLMVGIDQTTCLTDAMNILLERFMEDQTYSYGKNCDCGTLCDDFYKILSKGCGFDVPYETVSITEPKKIEACTIVGGKNRTGNTDGGQAWIFRNHFQLKVDGEVIDVLFAMRGSKQAQTGIEVKGKPSLYRFGDEMYKPIMGDDPNRAYAKISGKALEILGV
jgi:hypothetical protein